MNRSPKFLVACLVAAVALPAAAQSTIARVPTITRLVKVFSDLEVQLSEAANRRDEAGLGKLLAKDFELRGSAAPGDPIPRADWLVRTVGEPPSSSVIEQMAVHDHGKIAIVSFQLQQRSGPDAATSGTKKYLVVDTWADDSGVWRLKVRYIAPAGDPNFRLPGYAPALAPEKKY
jgi:hypothetical protein